MALLTIPVRPSVPFSRRRVTLDGREYSIRLRWSMREEIWYLDLFDVDGEPLLVGRPLTANKGLLAQFRQTIAALPPGELYALDPRATPADPGLDELGDVVSLAYEEAA